MERRHILEVKRCLWEEKHVKCKGEVHGKELIFKDIMISTKLDSS